MRTPTTLNIAKAIQEVRGVRGLSQTELSAKCGLQPSAISHYETGRRSPSAKNLVRIAASLGTTADALLGQHVDDQTRLVNLFNALTDHDRSTVLGLMEQLSQRRPL